LNWLSPWLLHVAVDPIKFKTFFIFDKEVKEFIAATLQLAA